MVGLVSVWVGIILANCEPEPAQLARALGLKPSENISRLASCVELPYSSELLLDARTILGRRLQQIDEPARSNGDRLRSRAQVLIHKIPESERDAGLALRLDATRTTRRRAYGSQRCEPCI